MWISLAATRRFMAGGCLVFLAVGMISCSAPAPTVTRMQTPTAAPRDNPLATRLYQDINGYRRSKGLGELVRHPGLDRLAQEHVEYLRKHRGTFKLNGRNISHIGFESRSVVARARYNVFNISENIASANNPGSSRAAATLLQLWQNSKPHHDNLLEPWTHTGVGVVVDRDGTVFADQLFATMSSSRMSMRNRLSSF